MEAGNRCFDANVPEETNRRLVDPSADFNLACTEHARRNLLGEGLEPRRVIVTRLADAGGARSTYREQIDASEAPWNWTWSRASTFVSAHREENVDNPNGWHRWWRRSML